MAPITEADGVFQGGGVKGLAIAGALLVFAEHPKVAITEWQNVAGTSAGAIIAAYLATDHSAAELKNLLDHTDFRAFEDWGPGGEIAGGMWNLARHHGLAHGEAFRRWFDDQIGGVVFGDLRRADDTPDKGGGVYRLRMIATDVTRQEMLVLPGDLAQYKDPRTGVAIDPDAYKVADAVRMSMSIPFFFQPIELEALDGTVCTIVDGGVLSNFPVWLFDVGGRDPQRPTFGLRLVGGKGVAGGLDHIVDALGWPAKLAGGMWHTASAAWDKRFVSESTLVRTCTVSAGNVATTDFALDDDAKRGLVEGGMTAARDYLDAFDPGTYVNTYGRRLGS